MSGLSGLENLLDRAQQTIGIVQHQAIEFAALGLIHIAVLQGLKIKPDGSNGRLQFVSDGIDKAVMLLVTPNFVHQEAGIHNQPGNRSAKKITPRKSRTPSRQLRMIQPTFSPTASSTRQTPSTTKKAIALRRLVMRMAGFYRLR